MQFRRSGQRDERRRRVLMDEMRGSAGESDAETENSPNQPGSTEPAPERRYSAAALESNQPPVTSLIPKRPWTMLVIFLTGLTGVAAVEYLYVCVYSNARVSTRAVLTALDVEARGSLLGWYSSVLMLLAAAVSLMVYTLRRHRSDDYRGRYRVWHWVGLGCLLASIDVATGLHDGVARLVTQAAGPLPYGEPSLWLAGIYAFVLSAVALRILLEVRSCATAIFSLFLAAGFYVTTSLVRMDLVPLPCELVGLMLQSSCLMLGHLFVSLSVIVYCRRVYCESQGGRPPTQERQAAPRRKRKTTTRRSASRKDPEAQPVRIDSAHDQSAGRAGGKKPASTEAPTQTGATEEAPRKLSKSERRRLRKQARRNRTAEA
jgi:hypothetical protein